MLGAIRAFFMPIFKEVRVVANRIKGITVEIGGDTTGLDKALKSVNSSITKTQSALNDVNRLLKLDPANVKHFFTLLGKMFFTSYGKEFFTYLGKQIFTS